MSSDIQWAIIRNHSSHLIKHGRYRFSTEPNNLLARHSKRFNGYINPKTVGVEPIKKGGVTLVLKRPKFFKKPVKMYERIRLTRDRRSVYRSIRSILQRTCYRRNLAQIAVKRACVLLTSNMPGKLDKMNKKTKRKLK